TAGRAREVVRVLRTAVDEVVALEGERDFGRVGLAEYDSARRLVARDARRVLFGHEPRAPLRAADRDEARRLERVLYRHGHAVQRPPNLAARERLVRLLRARTRGLFGQEHYGVDARINFADAREVRLDHLGRRDLLTPYRARQRRRGRVDDFVHKLS